VIRLVAELEMLKVAAVLSKGLRFKVFDQKPLTPAGGSQRQKMMAPDKPQPAHHFKTIPPTKIDTSQKSC